jgi:hypothetical protein
MRLVWHDAMVGFMAAAMIPPPANKAYPQKPLGPLHRIEPGPDCGTRIINERDPSRYWLAKGFSKLSVLPG